MVKDFAEAFICFSGAVKAIGKSYSSIVSSGIMAFVIPVYSVVEEYVDFVVSLPS